MRDSIYNARDSFPCRRIELELNKQSPFAVALIAEKRSPLTWLTSAGIRSLAVTLISFLNTSSFLVKERKKERKAQQIKDAVIEAKQVAAQLQLMAGQLDRLVNHNLAEANE